MRTEKNDFEDVPVLDNFYQTSSFYPMPVVLVSTMSESGKTNLGPYSLCFPHVISGRHAMVLIARGNSNTANNIRRTKLAALNFIPDERKWLENCVLLGFPGQTTDEKMKDSIFILRPSCRTGGELFPEIVSESVQVFECRWDESHQHEVNGLEHHYLLQIEKIVMQPKWHQALRQGGQFPHLPIDYGYRDNMHFWFAPAKAPYSVDVPTGRGLSAEAIVFDGNRIDPKVTWQLDAAAMLVNVPRIFLKPVLNSCVDAAKARGIHVVTPDFLTEIRSKNGQPHSNGFLSKLQRLLNPHQEEES